MRVSIALTTYNGESYLSDQLKSILSQTRLPDEVVIADDNSKDRTIDILEHFKEVAPFEVIIIKNSSNLGFVQNFNLAISKTTGEYIMLCDQDDVWFDNKIEFILKLFSESNKKIIINDALITDDKLSPIGITQLEQVKNTKSSEDYYVLGCATTFKKELKKILLPIPSKVSSHDGWIAKLGIGLDLRLVSKEPLQFYRRHNSNVSNSLSNKLSRITSWDKVLNFYMRLNRNKYPMIFKNHVRIYETAQELKKRINELNLSEIPFIDPENVNTFNSILDRDLRLFQLKSNMRKLSTIKRLKLVINLQTYKSYSHLNYPILRLLIDVFRK